MSNLFFTPEVNLSLRVENDRNFFCMKLLLIIKIIFPKYFIGNWAKANCLSVTAAVFYCVEQTDLKEQ